MKKIGILAAMMSFIFCASINEAYSGDSVVQKTPLSLRGNTTSCRLNADCVVLDLSCCPNFCSEGHIVAVNKRYKEEVEAKNRASCNENDFCTMNFCFPPYAMCENGECTTTKDGWNLCDNDDDCQIVELGCCDHCNGGRVIAANKNAAAMVRFEQGDFCELGKNGETPVCTQMACEPELARCDQGRCINYIDSHWILFKTIPRSLDNFTTIKTR